MYSVKYILFKVLKKLRLYGNYNSIIHKTSKIESGSTVVNTNLGAHSFCGYDCTIINTDIGKYTSIGSGVIIGGGSHPLNWISTSPAFYEGRDSIKLKLSKHSRDVPKRTIIKNDVWIGDGVIIKQGVIIGNGAVVGFGSRVTKDIPDYAIVSGNPSKILRYRFDEELIEKLINSSWWDSSEIELRNAAKFATNPKRFLDELKKGI
jgi:chloramphenicol O-acetyltransferase type B